MGPDDDLYSVIETHPQRTVHLFVYNSDTNQCREVRSCEYHVTVMSYIQIGSFNA